MYPLLLKPAFKDYIWGGTRLRSDFGKECDFERVAESWELSCHKDGESVIANEEHSGSTLTEYIQKEGRSVLGGNCLKFDSFPILIKLIDAKDNLSVQVHPDNEYAQRVEGEYGKTEMWYIVDADEGAQLIYGFRSEISREDFRRAIETDTLMDKLNYVNVKKGDVYFIEAGTLHAIGKGILIAEIQQNSNTTYRVYDYGRIGADGKQRPLHIDKAVEVTTLAPAQPYPQQKTVKQDGYTSKLLSKCDCFTVSSLSVSGFALLEADSSSFNSILILESCAKLVYDGGVLKLKKGDSVFIPAGLGKYSLTGQCEAILTTV